jgi:cytochrome c-type biogenesis protein CcmE
VRALLVMLALAACNPIAPAAEPTYLMVDELLARDLGELAGRPLKVHGFVEAGSIRTQIVAQASVRTFVLGVRGKRLRVTAKGPVPDTFRDQAELVATGRLVGDDSGYVLEASELAAKCPSRYGDTPKGAPPKFR